MKDYDYKDIDYEQVLYHFPGKSMDKIKQAWDIICQSRFNRTLNALKPSDF